jgi:nucleoside-diphosphate-sugar epimerase
MKIFVTGATGAIGLPTVRLLVDAGHTVRAVARSAEKASALEQLGADPVDADIFDAASAGEAVRGSEAVLHLATNVPVMRRAAKRRAWDLHNALRTTATRVLVDAARGAGASTFVKESIVFVYGDHGDEWIDEDTPPDRALTWLAPTVEGEEIAGEFGDGDDRRAVVLRFGLFYGPHARGTYEALRLARMRLGPLAGGPSAYLSSVHTDDVAAAVVAALDAPGGVYNICDDEPVTRREYLDAFSAGFGLHRLHRLPLWPLRIRAGYAARVLTLSQRCRNQRFRDATGWAPQYRNVREGWRAVAGARAGVAA